MSHHNSIDQSDSVPQAPATRKSSKQESDVSRQTQSADKDQLVGTYDSEIDPLLSFPEELVNLDREFLLPFDFDAEGEKALNFDLSDKSFGNVAGGVTNLEANELHEKRKASQDQDDADEAGGKRRGDETGLPRKAGRKPVAAEPTTKRKAQNRAAQRAFRERKEKHVKDLETKVEDLEKASETAYQENGLLRKYIEKLQQELNQYRQRISLAARASKQGRHQSRAKGTNEAVVKKSPSSADNDFHFEFPRFGEPAAHQSPILNRPGEANITLHKPPSATSLSAPTNASVVPGIVSRGGLSSSLRTPAVPSLGASNPSSIAVKTSVENIFDPLSTQPAVELQQPGNVYRPPLIPNTSGVFPTGFTPTSTAVCNSSPQNKPSQPQQSTNSANQSHSSYTNSESPESMQDSQHNASSLCTSPEENLISPTQKLADFDPSTSFEDTSAPVTVADLESFTWLMPENAGGTDPTLFGDYRESREVSDAQDFGSYIKEAFPLPALGSSEQTFPEVAPSPGKPDPTAGTEVTQLGMERIIENENESVSDQTTCPFMKERIRSVRGLAHGDPEMDGLCSLMKSKAQCSEGRPHDTRHEHQQRAQP